MLDKAWVTLPDFFSDSAINQLFSCWPMKLGSTVTIALGTVLCCDLASSTILSEKEISACHFLTMSMSMNISRFDRFGRLMPEYADTIKSASVTPSFIPNFYSRYRICSQTGLADTMDSTLQGCQTPGVHNPLVRPHIRPPPLQVTSPADAARKKHTPGP